MIRTEVHEGTAKSSAEQPILVWHLLPRGYAHMIQRRGGSSNARHHCRVLLWPAPPPPPPSRSPTISLSARVLPLALSSPLSPFRMLGSSCAGLPEPRPTSELVVLPLPPPLQAPSPPTPTPAAKPLSAHEAVAVIPERLPREWWRDSALPLPVLGGFGEDDEDSVRCDAMHGTDSIRFLSAGEARRESKGHSMIC